MGSKLSEFVLEMSSVHGHKRLKTTTRFSRLSLQESTSVAVRVFKESCNVFLGFFRFFRFYRFFCTETEHDPKAHKKEKHHIHGNDGTPFSFSQITAYKTTSIKHYLLNYTIKNKKPKNLHWAFADF